MGYTSYAKRTLCSDSSVISVHERQAPKEHRREEPTRIRSCPSLCFSSGASGLPSTVNYEVVHNFYPARNRCTSDFYAGGFQNDLAWRRDWCERAGLGFGLQGLGSTEQLVRAKAA